LRLLLEPRDLAGVRDDVDRVDLRHLLDRVDDPVEDRAAPDREQLLRPGVGKRTEARRVPGRENDRLHAASDSTNGVRWTPFSVTIAVISSAGVTSKAGLRAAKRAVTSAGSRSSIGMRAPSGVPRSTVVVGATM